MRCKHNRKQIESEEEARNTAKRGRRSPKSRASQQVQVAKISRSRSQNTELFPLILHTEWGLWFYHCTTVVMVNPRPLWLHHKIDLKTNTQLHGIFPVFSSHGLNLPYELLIHLSCKFWPNRDICKVTLLEKPTQPMWPKLIMGLELCKILTWRKKVE